MKKATDRKNIIRQIEQAAEAYREKLVGKKFLYVFDGRYIEVLYKAENFRHLTGVAAKLGAKRFYSYAARRILAVSDIGFDAIHPYDLCIRKIQHISEVANLAGSEGFMLEDITTQTQCYKFGVTDLNFTLCMNKERDDEGREKGDCFVVQSLRDEDCFEKSNDVYTVTHILSKQNDAKEYTDVIFMDVSPDRCELPETVKKLVAPSLLRQLEAKNGAL